MLAIDDAVGDLKFANVAHNIDDLFLRHLHLRRHVPERPMVLPHAELGRDEKSFVSVMAGIVDVVNKWRTLVGSGAVQPVALGACRVEGLLALGRLRSEVRNFHGDLISGDRGWAVRLRQPQPARDSEKADDEIFWQVIVDFHRTLFSIRQNRF